MSNLAWRIIDNSTMTGTLLPVADDSILQSITNNDLIALCQSVADSVEDCDDIKGEYQGNKFGWLWELVEFEPQEFYLPVEWPNPTIAGSPVLEPGEKLIGTIRATRPNTLVRYTTGITEPCIMLACLCEVDQATMDKLQ